MLSIQEIKEIIQMIDDSSISEFSYDHEGSQVTIKKSTITAPVVNSSGANQMKIETGAVEQEDSVTPGVKISKEEHSAKNETVDRENITEIVSPMVGTFYRKPSPDSDTYVEIGDTVKNDSVVCTVEAMKLFNEIEAETAGEIVEILVDDGELVEYGQALFTVKTK